MGAEQTARKTKRDAQSEVGVLNDPVEGAIQDFLHHVAFRVGNDTEGAPLTVEELGYQGIIAAYPAEGSIKKPLPAQNWQGRF